MSEVFSCSGVSGVGYGRGRSLMCVVSVTGVVLGSSGAGGGRDVARNEN